MRCKDQEGKKGQLVVLTGEVKRWQKDVDLDALGRGAIQGISATRLSLGG
jgi:hypothetical protein